MKKRNSNNSISKIPLSKKGVLMMLGATLGAIPITTVLPTDAEAMPTDVTVSVGSVSGNPGDIVYVPVSIDTPSMDIDNYGLEIDFDSTKLRFISAEDKRNSVGFMAMDFGQGLYMFDDYNDDARVSTSGELFVLQFEILESASVGDTSVSIDSTNSAIFGGSNNNRLEVSLISGVVTVNESNTFSIGTATAKAGQEVDVPVSIANLSLGLSAYGAQKIEFDPSKLEVISITQSHGTPEEFESNFNNTEGWFGAAWVDSTGGDQPITDDSTLFNVRFKVKDGAATGDAQLTLNKNIAGNLELTASDQTNLAANLTVGKVTVLANIKPTVVNISKTINEDMPLIFTATDFSSQYTETESEAMASIQITSLPANGVLTFDGTTLLASDLPKEIAATDIGKLSFVPNADWNDEATGTSFEWKASDGVDYSEIAASVIIKVASVQDTPTFVQESEINKSMGEDTSVTFSGTDFSAKVNDADGESLAKIKVETLPANGQLKLNDITVTAGQEIAVSDLANLTFTPDANWNGNTSFTWQASDGIDYTPNSATVHLTVNAVNDAPTAANAAITGTTLITTTLTASYTFLDVDGDVETNTTYQWYRADDANGTNQTAISGAVDKTYVLDANDDGKYISFEVIPADAGGNGTSVQSAYVGPVKFNVKPTLNFGTSLIGINETYSFTSSFFTDAFTDVDSHSLEKIKITELPANGSLKLVDGTNETIVTANEEISKEQFSQLQFVPDENWSGSTTIKVSGYDGVDYSDEAAFIIHVYEQYDKPYEITGVLTIENGLKATATISLKDHAVPASGLTYVVFQLMKGTTPVSVKVVEKTLQTTENVSVNFDVAGSDYSVIVNVLDQELSHQTDVGISLADSNTLTFRP